MKQKHEQLMAKLKACQEMHQHLKDEAEELEGNEVEAFMRHMQLHQCENQLLLAEPYWRAMKSHMQFWKLTKGKCISLRVRRCRLSDIGSAGRGYAAATTESGATSGR